MRNGLGDKISHPDELEEIIPLIIFVAHNLKSFFFRTEPAMRQTFSLPCWRVP
jgi:hypothetical protein